jgi:hypothetical protein
VSECFGADVSSCHFLEPVVANSGGRAQAGFYIALVDNFSLLGGVCPHAGKAVRLQLQAYRQRIGLRWVRLAHPLHFALYSKQLLNMMSDFVSDYVSLRKFSGGSELVFQLLKKA